MIFVSLTEIKQKKAEFHRIITAKKGISGIDMNRQAP